MKISVITVSYNSEATIGDTVRSVASQSYENIEHLVIDGKSTDATIKVVEANRHPKLILSSEPDDGIYDAMNKGLKQATGELIGFLNSDDFYAEPTVLDKVVAAFHDDSIEACYADLVYVTPDNSRVARLWKSKAFVNGDFAKGWSPAHPTFYVRRSALARLGLFDQSFKLAADAEFMMRYLEAGKIKSVYIPNVLVRMRLGGATNQSLKNIWEQNKEIFIALHKNKIHYNAFIFIFNKIFSRVCQFASALMLKINSLRQAQ
jgi:glycosyltransferase involved in cell wall biosynthesis